MKTLWLCDSETCSAKVCRRYNAVVVFAVKYRGCVLEERMWCKYTKENIVIKEDRERM